MTEDDMVGWHHRLDGREFEQGDSERQGSLARCSPWGHRVRHDCVTEQQDVQYLCSRKTIGDAAEKILMRPDHIGALCQAGTKIPDFRGKQASGINQMLTIIHVIYTNRIGRLSHVHQHFLVICCLVMLQEPSSQMLDEEQCGNSPL